MPLGNTLLLKTFSMNWQVIVDSYARKYLKKIPASDADRIAAVLREFAVNPYAGDIEKLDGEEDTWRRRVGSYRIFYEVYTSKKIVYVSEVRRRASNTY